MTRELYLTLALICVGLGCASRGRVDSGSEPVYSAPEQTSDGWETSSMERVGMLEGPVMDLLKQLRTQNEHNVHGILVARRGKLVVEAYFPGEHVELAKLGDEISFPYTVFDRNTLHLLASASKSVTSILFGIARDKGIVRSVDETMFSFFPEYSYLSDQLKERITIAQMLAMTSGLPWNEGYPYDDIRNDWVAMVHDQDPIAYVLGKPAFAEPGTRFRYNSGTTNLLGEIISRRSGITLAEFARHHLFAPLGIRTFEWYGFPNAPEMAVASSTLYLRPRDMAKIGQMYLDGGVWNGTRIVSRSWVAESTSKIVDLPDSESPIPGYVYGYGMQWWLGRFSTSGAEFLLAAGFGGQLIVVLPEVQMVVVFTAGNLTDPDYGALLAMVDNHILRALSN